jgi:hypothetical protein
MRGLRSTLWGARYEQTLYDVHDYAASAGIPYRHVQLDSWWYIKAATAHGPRGGTKSWSPAPNTFPDGLTAFSRKSGWRITAHNRMWSSENVYAKQNGGKFNWIIDGRGQSPCSFFLQFPSFGLAPYQLAVIPQRGFMPGTWPRVRLVGQLQRGSGRCGKARNANAET